MHFNRSAAHPSSLQALLEQLLARARQAPHPGSLPLFINGRPCGWLFPSAARALAGMPEVEVGLKQAHIGQHCRSEAALNLVLSQVATTLRQAGCAPGWRNELLDVWVADLESNTFCAERIGAIERGVVRPLGLVTRAVHLNGWSEDGQLWVARRALTKATDPGMWDTLVGGLISTQEDIELALVRESDEEAGLSAEDISKRTPLRTITRMRRQVPEGFQAEDVLTCECVLPEGVVPQNRDGEVMEIQRLRPEIIAEMLAEGAFTVEASIVIAEELLRRATHPPV